MNILNSMKSEELCIMHPLVPCDSDIQIKTNFEDNYLDHQSNLNFKSNLSQNPLTTLACSVLPNVTKDIIEGLCQKGISMVMFDFYSLSPEQCQKMIYEIRLGVFNYSLKNNQVPYAMALVLDLKGPCITTGTILNSKDEVYSLELQTNKHIFVTNDLQYRYKCTVDRIYVSSDGILQLKKDDRIYLDYGKIELAVERVDPNEVYCAINRGELLGSEKVVHIPRITIGLTALTEQDEESICVGIKLKVDVIMISGVRNAVSFNRVKKFVCQEKGDKIDLYAKIDNSMGLENIDEIIPNVDGVFLHQPNLSIEIGYERIFLAQKIVLSTCIKAGKPTIMHGGFLNSMEFNTLPSNVEINNMINTVLDGTDCIYLDVTKRSAHLVHCVQYASTVCRRAESAMWHQQLYTELNKKSKPRIDPANAISIGCVEVSLQCHAAAIVIITTSGLSAKLIAMYRPKCPILAIVEHGKFARKINVYRNIVAVQYMARFETNWTHYLQNRTKFAMKFGKNRGLFKQGDIVVRMSLLEQNSKFTNTMNLFYVGAEDFV